MTRQIFKYVFMYVIYILYIYVCNKYMYACKYVCIMVVCIYISICTYMYVYMRVCTVSI